MDKRKNKKKTSRLNSRKSRKKLTIIRIFMMSAFIFLLCGSTFYLDVVRGKEFRQRILNSRAILDITIPFQRGEIRDRNGIVMADSEQIFDVIIDPKAFEETYMTDKKERQKAVKETAKMLNRYFDIPERVTIETVKKNPQSRYQILGTEKSREDKRLFLKEQKKRRSKKKNALPACGVSFTEKYRRRYPYDNSACEVIGLVGRDGSASHGLEEYYNSTLSGKNGRKYYYMKKNANLTEETSEPKDGNTLVTTIDMNLQKMLEDRLSAFSEKHEKTDQTGKKRQNGCLHAAVLVMDPNTGEVLAQANYPSYNLNDPGNAAYYDTVPDKVGSEGNKVEFVRKNFCISDTFEPGSTAKPFTVSAALMTDTLKNGASYVCNGEKQVADKKIACHKRDGHGRVNVEEGLAYSCNVAMMDIVENMDVNDFCRYQHIFGLGSRTGIDLPGEKPGHLIPSEDMNVVDLATNAFGQNFDVTMMQMAAGFSSIVNGGNYYQPHVVKQIQDPQGHIIRNISPKLKRKTVSEAVSREVKKGLKGVMTYGTGRDCSLKGYDIGGKTGTAEKIPRKDGNILLSFIGCAPLSNPEVVYYVVIDEINEKDQNMHSAIMELSKNVASDILPYLHITGNGEEIEKVPDPVLKNDDSDEKDFIEKDKESVAP